MLVGLDLGGHGGGGGEKGPNHLNFPDKDYLISYHQTTGVNF